jgi:hypothetical protein
VALETPVKIFVFAVFLAMGLSAMPLMLRLFLAGQRRIGNAAHPLVRLLAAHETFVVVGFWSMCAVGLAIAIPFAIKDGFFGPAAGAWLETAMIGRSRGVLVANAGMTVDEVRRRSTLAVAEAKGESLTGSSRLIAEVVFDLQIGDTGTRLEGCRYYFVVTRPRGDLHVESMNVGVSPRARTRAELDEAMRGTRERLRADGWAMGRFVYRTAEQQAPDLRRRGLLLAQGRGAPASRAQAGGRGAARRGSHHRAHGVELVPAAGLLDASALARALLDEARQLVHLAVEERDDGNRAVEPALEVLIHDVGILVAHEDPQLDGGIGREETGHERHVRQRRAAPVLGDDHDLARPAEPVEHAGVDGLGGRAGEGTGQPLLVDGHPGHVLLQRQPLGEPLFGEHRRIIEAIDGRVTINRRAGEE